MSQADNPTWADASLAFGEAVREYHGSRCFSSEDAAVASTVRTNTELVPQRGDTLLSLLEQLTNAGGLEGKRVLEVGSGFGALAAYLAIAGTPDHLVAIDNRTDFVESAVKSTEKLGLSARLTFLQSDMRALHPVGDEPFNLVIVNNALIYLPTRKDMRVALREFARVMAPGGFLLIYHANRWTTRDPFSKDPVVHLLPRPAAEAVSRVTGWRHNHGRVRLVSPIELTWLVRRAGFDSVRYGGMGTGGLQEGKLFRPFYALAARKPPG